MSSEHDSKVVFEKDTGRFLLKIKLSSDKMKLFIDVKPSGPGLKIKKDELIDVIGQFSALTPNEEVLQDVVQQLDHGKEVTDRRIVKGREATAGIDGKLLILVKAFTGKGATKVDEKGGTDLTHLELFDNIVVDQLVARIYPPKPGSEGRNALGQPVPSTPGKPAAVSLDKTLKVTAAPDTKDYEIVVAQAEGCLVNKGGKLSIMTEFVISGNLDYRYGSLDFIGAIKIQGDVLPGFNVKAKNGITVTGSVQGGSLIAVKGPIVVNGFVFGGKGAKIISGESFKAKMVQEINADIRKEITIDKEAKDSILRCGSVLHMNSSQLIGGEAFPVCGAEIKNLGSEGEKTTILNFCSDIEASLEYGELVEQIHSHDKAAELIKLHLGPYANNPTRLQVLAKPYREKMEKLLQKFKMIEDSRIKLLTKKQSMLEGAKINASLRVNILGVIHPGVVITAGDKRFSLSESLKGPKSVTFNPETGEFTVGELQPLECSMVAIPKKEEKDEKGRQEKGNK